MPLRFETLTGDALPDWLPALARLRIAVFRDWPYLYRGDRRAEARDLGLPRASFCAVRREPGDPRRPAGHRPLEGFWCNRGYASSGIARHLSWREIGGRGQAPHALDFWERAL